MTKYTHNAKFYGIPCYFNEVTGELDSKYQILEPILTFFIWIECQWPTNEAGFPIEVGSKLNDNNLFH